MSERSLRLILGDQLNYAHSWYMQVNTNVVYLIAEMRQETDYVRHHIQKVCAFFASMRAFAGWLEQQGHRVVYLSLDDTQNDASLSTLLARIGDEYGVDGIEYQRPDEYRLLQQLRAMRYANKPLVEHDSEHFLLPWSELESTFAPSKHRTMEYFYRDMRRRYNVLMDGAEPVGGRWNFDQENRKPISTQAASQVPPALCFDNDVTDILARLQRHNVQTIGTTKNLLAWPVDRDQSLALLDYFCAQLLPRFGDFQDAMTTVGENRWSLYHSRLSFSLNAKLLSPLEVVEAVLCRYQTPDDPVELAAVEGFIRQIIGWREFVRGVYWANMPAYEDANALDAQQPLPSYFWTGETRMRCLSEAIGQSLEHAYAHHIQRLMITGNFCLLAGIKPSAVDEWYLGIYADALQWVELPNTRGMSQFADGGLIATKPYCASGSYVHRMSDYCKGCHYNVKGREQDDACPLNSLYWHFIHRHKDRFANNQRMRMPIRNLERMTPDVRTRILARAEWCLDNLDQL